MPQLEGPIRDKYLAAGGEAVFGAATTERMPVADGVYQSCERAVFYLKDGSREAFFARGLIFQKWGTVRSAQGRGWEQGPLGWPVSDEYRVARDLGWGQRFERGTFFYRDGRPEAFWSTGLILEKYASTGWEQGELGFPVTDHAMTPDGRGAFQHFDGTDLPASIYYNPNQGKAWIVKGVIRAFYAATGWERGVPFGPGSLWLTGFPLRDEYLTAASYAKPGLPADAFEQDFEGANIYWPRIGSAEFVDPAYKG